MKNYLSGNEIKKYRKKLQLSQVKLAAIAGVSRFNLYLYENDLMKLSFEDIEKITIVLKKAGEKFLIDMKIGGNEL